MFTFPGAALDCHNLFLIVLRIQRCCENANDGRDEIDLKMDEEDDDDHALHAISWMKMMARTRVRWTNDQVPVSLSTSAFKGLGSRDM